jgi:PKD repeat protein
MPTGGRRITGHKRDISNRDGFKFTREGNGNPGYINVPLNGNGEYLITLSTTDNENNTVSETFSLTVSDPVAIIKKTPSEGTTSITFSFDASTSYSLTSRLKLYTREIFDANGDKIDTFQAKSIKKQFIKPGNYTVKLTIEDELGQTNIDTQEVYVESSVPIPQFTITPTNKRAQPSEYHLDATATTDIDVTNKSDSLEYKREFSNPNASTITAQENNQSKIVVQFEETGKHTIRLIVTDMYGKSATLEKTVEVTSILRPELTIKPNAVTHGETVSFSVQTNKPITHYQRNFDDGNSNANQENTIQHTYQKIGIYNVTVTVSDAAGNSNSVTEKVFIGETGFPIVAFKIKDNRGFFLQTTETCEVTDNEETISHPAYLVDRYQNIVIDPSASINSKGGNAGLAFYFQPKYEEVYKQSTFTHKFNEIGCQYIDVHVNDTSIGKEDVSRIRFKVVNALPTLKNITLSYPQYGNES